MLGICNGFQALVKAGILPFPDQEEQLRRYTLSFNAQGKFECRWVNLQPTSEACIWTHGLEQPLTCPVAHGEGNFKAGADEDIKILLAGDQVALVYATAEGHAAQGAYPANPNGSAMDIAGICNPQGNVLGLMPHPENHIFVYQYPLKNDHPQPTCLPLIANGMHYATQL